MIKEQKGRAKGVKNPKTVAVARAKLVADGVIARALVVPSVRSGARLKAGLEAVTRSSLAARSSSPPESKMSKVPNTAPIKAPLTEPRDVSNKQQFDRLIAEDRKNLSSFVENLNKGVTFDSLDDDLKSWWMNRY